MKHAHIAVALPRLKSAVPAIEEIVGIKASAVEEVPDEKVRLQFLEVGGIRLEFLEPTSDDSPISRFLQKRGSGIHHLAFRVENLREKLKQLKEKGIRLIHEEPKKGAEGCDIAFIHPSSAGGILIELVEESSH